MSLKHKLYNKVFHTIKNYPFQKGGVHLQGESGSGKSHMLRQIAKELGKEFYFINCTRQMSEGALKGFLSVSTQKANTTLFRKAVEEGAMFCFEELNSMDPNTFLTINSLPTGDMAFPDKIIKVHPDFKLVATSNPNDSEYGARDELDFSTLNRFKFFLVEKDEALAIELANKQAVEDIQWLREFYKSIGVSQKLTMRDEERLAIDRGIEELKDEPDPLLDLTLYQNKDVQTRVALAWEQELKKREEIRLAEIKRLEEERIEREKQEAFAKKSRFEVDNLEDFLTKVEEGK